MHIPGPAGELFMRRAAALREQEQRDDKNAAKNIIQNEQHPRRGDEEEEGEGGEEDKKERDHRRLTKNEASDASKNRAKRAMWKKLLEYDPASKKKKSKDDDDSLFEQKQYQTIQWLKNGGWRSGRLSKGRFIVEKAKKIKRKSGMRVFGGGGGGGKGGGDQNQTRASSSSSSSSSLKVFDGSLLVSDENGDTMTATCDGETLQMLLNHKNETKKRKTRVGVIVKDVAVLNASATEQHLVLKRKSLVEIFFQEEEEEEEEKKGSRGKENAGTVAIDVGRVEKAAPHSQVPQPKAVSAFALQAMKLMEKRKAKAAAKAAEAEEERRLD